MTIPGMTEEEKEREKDLQQTLTKIAQEQKNITETVGRLRNRLADLDARMREACKNRRRQKPSLVRNVKNRLSRIASRIADRLAE